MCYIDQPDWLEPQFCHLQLCDPDLELSKPRILHLYNRGRNTLLSWQIMQCGWHDAWPLSAVIAESRTLDRGLHMFPWALLPQSPPPPPRQLNQESARGQVSYMARWRPVAWVKVFQKHAVTYQCVIKNQGTAALVALHSNHQPESRLTGHTILFCLLWAQMVPFSTQPQFYWRT